MKVYKCSVFLPQLNAKIYYNSLLVNTDALAYFAKELGFGKFMIISRHVEDKCSGRESSKILEDAFESFIGAMFLDFNETELDGDYEDVSVYVEELD